MSPFILFLLIPTVGIPKIKSVHELRARLMFFLAVLAERHGPDPAQSREDYGNKRQNADDRYDVPEFVAHR
jgi:hypothetical protein